MKKIYDFGASPGTKTYYEKWRQANRARINDRARKRYAANPDKHRERAKEYRSRESVKQYLKKKYEQDKASGKSQAWSRAHRLKYDFGITPEQYDELLASQNGVCAICASSTPRVKRLKYLCVDHCHKTNKVRGLLCNSCNTAIGHFRENQDVLASAISYLSKHS